MLNDVSVAVLAFVVLLGYRCRPYRHGIFWQVSLTQAHLYRQIQDRLQLLPGAGKLLSSLLKENVDGWASTMPTDGAAYRSGNKPASAIQLFSVSQCNLSADTPVVLRLKHNSRPGSG